MQRKLENIEKDIKSISRTRAVTSDDNPNMPLLLACHGRAHDKRFDILHDLEDNYQAIENWTLALVLTPDDHPLMPSLLSSVGTAHGQRFQRLGNTDNINQAIKYACLGLSLLPNGHEDLPRQLGSLGVYHRGRFEHLGELEDLEQAMEYDSRAMSLTPNGHPYLPYALTNLGGSYTCRFQRLGELTDLEKAIEYESRAVHLTPDGHPSLSMRLANLGSSHSYRFERLGELADLEKAIEYKSRAVDLTPDGHPHLSSMLANLGSSHSHRFERLGELDDLEKAIECKSRAVDLTPDGHPDLSMRLANLGTSHSYRFERLGELADLKKAIEYKSRAVDLTPDGHPHLSSMLANLGTSHNYRFERLGELADLEKAIEYQSRAVDLTPDGHPGLSYRISNLGISYEHRFAHLSDLGDLEHAIHLQSRALAFTPDGHPYLSFFHLHHARSSFRYYQRTNALSHLQRSLLSFRASSQSIASAPRDRFNHARQWATYASQHSDLNPLEAYQATIELLPQFIWLGATTHQRYEDLSTTQALAVDAAYAALLSLNPALALEWLEHARCVIWTQNMMLRSPLDQLQSTHPALSTELRAVAEKLHTASSESRESQALASGSMSIEQVAQEHRSLAQRYNNLLSQVRALAGFEDFLRPLKAKNLVRAARYGAIVVINCHQDRCDALISLPEQDTVDHLCLPHFTAEMAHHARLRINMSVDSLRSRERGAERRPLVEFESDQVSEFGSVLAELWKYLVKPVLEFLGYTSNVPLGSLPHITWCPTGALSFLPLHAAGHYDQPRSRVYDYVVSSYTPTLTALLESTPTTLRCDSGVLAVGQAATPGHSRLPGTATELANVKSHTEHKARYSQLMDKQATTSAVLKEMEDHDWVHLTCHAHQNVGNATESGFFLHDGTLNLAAINRRSFKNKGLAYLSACQTATGDRTLADEAVHLASGMLMAGYSSVIATMWSVVDADAPIVADGVYAQLMKDGKLGNGEAGRALHDAVAVLRAEIGEKAFERWVPYIHIGS